MSESGGISENLDAGLRKEDSQEDGMPVSTQPNSRVSVDGDPDVMTLVRESCVLKPIGSGNRLWERKPVDLMVEDHVADTNGNVELETSPNTPAVMFRKKRIKLKTPAETKTQSRPRPTKSSSSTRTKSQDLASQINELKDSLATLTSAVSNFASGPGVRPGLGYDSFNTDSGLDLGPAPGGVQPGVNSLMAKVGGFPDYQDQYIRLRSPRLPSEDGGLSGSLSSRIQYRPPNLSGFTLQGRSRGEFISRKMVDANVHLDIDPDLDFSELFGDDTPNDPSLEAAPPEPSSLNEVSEQPFDDDLLDELEQFYSQNSQTGPKVNDKLSKLIHTMLRAKVSDEKMKEKAGRFRRPQNCENLVLPKVNPEIWSKMASRAKSRDLNLQNVQVYLIMGLIPVIQSLQKLYNWRKMDKKTADKSVSIGDEDLSGITSDLCDSFSLLAHSNYQMCLLRREYIKPELNAQFRSLCSSAPITSWLFGDDICGQIKDLQKHNQTVVRLT